jgi:hypothetical protein
MRYQLKRPNGEPRYGYIVSEHETLEEAKAALHQQWEGVRTRFGGTSFSMDYIWDTEEHRVIFEDVWT